ncbi:unnamed protein product [Sympodiomycopsis kandeliae]
MSSLLCLSIVCFLQSPPSCPMLYSRLSVLPPAEPLILANGVPLIPNSQSSRYEMSNSCTSNHKRSTRKQCRNGMLL